MHDPMCVAFEIRYPWRKYGRSGRSEFERNYRESFITIWHVDPERDGSDDSCGWFKRARHGDRTVLEKIERAFGHDWDTVHSHSDSTWYAGWFNPETGQPIMGVQGTALEMFRRAAFIHFGNDWGRTERFMKRNLYDILQFAENTTDSMRDMLIQRFGPAKREDRIASCASMLYGWILRAERPWYRHPRWHLHHWRIQVRPWQTFRRWALSRCCKCGKGFRWGESPSTDHWDSPPLRFLRGEEGIYHGDCRDLKNSGIPQAAGD